MMDGNNERRLRVFLCHSSGDKAAVRDLYKRLQTEGIQPWLDQEDLIPGQDWQYEIRNAVRDCDIVLVCLSKSSITKVGFVQQEIGYVLEEADRQPEGSIFLIPLKLEECDIPKRLSRWHWVKYFEENGYQHLMRALQHRAQTLGITLKPVSSIPSLSTELPGAAVSSLEVESKKPPASIPSKSLTDTTSHDTKAQYLWGTDGPIGETKNYNQTVPFLPVAGSQSKGDPLVKVDPGNAPERSPGIAFVPSVPPGLWRTRLSRRTLLGLLVGVGTGVAVVGGGGWFAFVRESSSSQTTPIPRPISRFLSIPLFTYIGHSASVTSVAWSPDGSRIASASRDGTVQIWDATHGGGPLFTYTDSSRTGTAVPVWSVAWSPDSKHVVSGGADRIARVWDTVHGGNALVTYQGHADEVTAVAWSPDGVRIASGSADKTVQVWDAVHGGSAQVTYHGHFASVPAVAWSPGGAHIASGSRDRTVQVWDAIRGGRAQVTYHDHTAAVNGVVWSPDGSRIASASDDNTVRVWDATKRNTLIIYKGHADHVNPVAWSPNGTQIASGSWDHTVRVWDATNGNTLIIYKGHAQHVNGVAWSPDGTHIASGSVDTTVQVWKVV